MMLRYSPRALGDLASLSEYLMEHSPAGANTVERAIRLTIDLLRQFPASGRSVRQQSRVRVMPRPRVPILIFDTVEDGQVRILHIRHSARRPIGSGHS